MGAYCSSTDSASSKSRASKSCRDPEVFLSPSASLKGKTVYLDDSDKPVYTYKGIPFGEPPVGELRLKKPLPKQLWQGQRDATEFGAPPVQTMEYLRMINPEMADKHLKKCSEDCLYLDVYTPSKKPSDRLPVMVWIYGGGWVMGSTAFYPGYMMASRQDIVFVAITYRVGLLGFFSSGDEVSPGNYGLWDQIEGLKWVQEHISKFGGDPSNVTLFGESAGGCSTSLLQMVPQASGLFHKSMKLSGVATLMPPLSGSERNKQNCIGLAKAFGLADGASPQDVYKWLMEASPDDIIAKSATLMPPSPVLDGELFTKTQNEILQEKAFSKMPCIISVNSHEGHLITKILYTPQLGLTFETKADFETLVRTLVEMWMHHQVKDMDAMVNGLIEHYIPQEKPNKEEIFKASVDLVGDHMFLQNINSYVKAYAEGVPEGTYYLGYGYRHSLAQSPNFVGADHGDDIPTVLGYPYMSKEDMEKTKFADKDKEITDIVLKYISNFVRTGNPNGGNLPVWSSFSPANPNHLYIDNQGSASVPGLYRSKHVELHNDLKAKY